MTRNRIAWGIAAIDIATILVTRLIDPSGDVDGRDAPGDAVSGHRPLLRWM